jgi:hypothetical protein
MHTQRKIKTLASDCEMKGAEECSQYIGVEELIFDLLTAEIS